MGPSLPVFWRQVRYWIRFRGRDLVNGTGYLNPAYCKENTMSEKTTTRKTTKNSGDEAAVLAAIAEMPEPERSMGGRLHALIRASAPELRPRT